MENTISTTLKHREHRDWLSTLDFYQQEITIFQKELFAVLIAHPDLPTIVEHVEEYRALFLRKLKTIDEIRYRIAQHESNLAFAPGTDMEQMHFHAETRTMMEEIEFNFETLKKNFRRFASRND